MNTARGHALGVKLTEKVGLFSLKRILQIRALGKQQPSTSGPPPPTLEPLWDRSNSLSDPNYGGIWPMHHTLQFFNHALLNNRANGGKLHKRNAIHYMPKRNLILTRFGEQISDICKFKKSMM